ncbi:MAG TPA: right-handed parallel beta-helix repeat-containing protein [Thermoanaerobaculia bacterium]|nr:right-handed parallel beta-helix repeat-containing protein [Thermoanaerobaculia bacterium]
MITGGNVQIDKCTIDRFTTGINFVPTVSGSQLHVTDSIVRNNTGPGATNGGIFIGPASASAKASIDHVRLESNTFGLKAQGTTNTTITNSTAQGNSFAGFSTASAGAVLTLEHSTSTHNLTGVGCGIGTVRIGNMTITDNPTAMSTGGTCLSFHNNDVDVTIAVTLISPTPQ